MASDDEDYVESRVSTLKFLALRSVSQEIFKANCSSHKDFRAAKYGARYLAELVGGLPLPPRVRKSVGDGLCSALREVRRWWDKHVELWPEKRRATKRGHLTLYFERLVWRPGDLFVDDAGTAEALIAANADWHQLQFQLASAYALEEVLGGFRSYHLAVFRKRLGEHPLYAFWLALLEARAEGKEAGLWAGLGEAPSQPVSLALQWSIAHGFQELFAFLWQRVSADQRRFVGLFQWRRVLKLAKAQPSLRFLCAQLCSLSPAQMLQMSWTALEGGVEKFLRGAGGAAAKELALAKLQFLLFHACPVLRQALLAQQDFKAFRLADAHREPRLKQLLLLFLQPQAIADAEGAVQRAKAKKAPRPANP